MLVPDRLAWLPDALHHCVASSAEGTRSTQADATDSASSALSTLPQTDTWNPFLRLSTSLNTLSCAVVLPPGTSAHVVTKLLADARRGVSALMQAVGFAALTQFFLALSCLFPSIIGSPPPLSLPHVLFLGYLPMTLLALSMVVAPEVRAAMTSRRTPLKRPEQPDSYDCLDDFVDQPVPKV